MHDSKKKNVDVTIIEENIIIIEGEKWHKHGHDDKLEIIKKLADAVDNLSKLAGKSRRPIFALTTFINNNQFILMADVKLVIGSPKSGLFTLIDNKTLLPISPVNFSNQAVGANSNPEFASFALDTNNPNQVIGSGIAAGSGTVIITTHAAYTDPGDGSPQEGDFSVTKNYTVVPSADGATFDVVFP